MQENITKSLGSQEVNLYTTFLPSGPLPQWLGITNIVVNILFLILALTSLGYYIYKTNYNKSLGKTNEEIKELIVNDNVDDLPDKALIVNFTIKKYLLRSFIVFAALGLLSSIGTMVNSHDKEAVYNAIQSTTSSSLEGAQIQGNMSEENIFKLKDDTLLKYKLVHKGGFTYDVELFTEDRSSTINNSDK